MFLFFIFYVFSSTKSENRRMEQVLQRWGKGIGTSGGGIQLQKGRKMNTVQIMYTHFAFVNAKMIHVETVPGTKGVGIKESCGRGEFKYDIFDTL
jgi:hypothetical protein